MDLAARVLKGDIQAAAKLISLIEDREAAADALVAKLYRRTGKAHLVGVTGPPGAGKSTLVNRLVAYWRKQRRKVGVLAVDPSSPFTGGAVLGDRVRMTEISRDKGVYIRSMATRGHLGGIALATYDAAKVVEALGMDTVIIETVGAGQSEVEIANLAHTVVVVEMPAAGDSMQALKAGILEIGDVYVVNKGDLEGAGAVAANLAAMIEPRDGWMSPVLTTSALEGKGVEKVAEAIDRHWEHLASSGRLAVKERQRAEAELSDALAATVRHRVRGPADRYWTAAVERIASRKQDPRAAAEELLRRART